MYGKRQIADINICKGMGPDRVEWSQSQLAKSLRPQYHRKQQRYLDIRAGKRGTLLCVCIYVRRYLRMRSLQLTTLRPEVVGFLIL